MPKSKEEIEAMPSHLRKREYNRVSRRQTDARQNPDRGFQFPWSRARLDSADDTWLPLIV